MQNINASNIFNRILSPANIVLILYDAPRNSRTSIETYKQKPAPEYLNTQNEQPKKGATSRHDSDVVEPAPEHLQIDENQQI